MGSRISSSAPQQGQLTPEEQLALNQQNREADQTAQVQQNAATAKTTAQGVNIAGDVVGSIVGAYNPGAGEAVKTGCDIGSTAISTSAVAYEAAEAPEGQETQAWMSAGSTIGQNTLSLYKEYDGLEQQQAQAYKDGAAKKGENAARLEARAQGIKEKNPDAFKEGSSPDPSNKQVQKYDNMMAKAETQRAKEAEWNAEAKARAPKTTAPKTTTPKKT